MAINNNKGNYILIGIVVTEGFALFVWLQDSNNNRDDFTCSLLLLLTTLLI